MTKITYAISGDVKYLYRWPVTGLVYRFSRETRSTDGWAIGEMLGYEVPSRSWFGGGGLRARVRKDFLEALTLEEG